MNRLQQILAGTLFTSVIGLSGSVVLNSYWETRLHYIEKVSAENRNEIEKLKQYQNELNSLHNKTNITKTVAIACGLGAILSLAASIYYDKKTR